MNGAAERRLERVGEMVRAVARQLRRDRRACIALLDDGTPEAALAARFLEPLGRDAVLRVRPDEQRVESLLHAVGSVPADVDARAEVLRLLLRLVGDSVPTCAVNKTALLLGGELPPEPFLPLGDLYASEISVLAGGWSAPPAVRVLAERAGGIEALDEALRRRFDGRDPVGLGRLPAAVAEAVEAALATGSASRAAPRLIPKLGTRTIGMDLFE